MLKGWSLAGHKSLLVHALHHDRLKNTVYIVYAYGEKGMCMHIYDKLKVNV